MSGVKGDRWGTDIYLDASIAVGAMPYKGANGKLLWLTPGALAQVLTSNGVSPAIPSYQAAAGGGGLVLLEQHTASASASLDFTTAFTSTYDDYVVRIVGLRPVTSATSLYMKISTDGGATWVAGTSYQMWYYGHDWANNAGQSVATNTSQFLFGNASLCGNGSSSSASGSIDLFNMLHATKHLSFEGKLIRVGDSDGISRRYDLAGTWSSATPVNAIRFVYSSGNIADGVVRVYGVPK